MEHQIGKQIRTHRLRCNMTQERLAETLGVTAQAVSKWENGASYPDITLLPELSAVLGITIDALFESGMETHLQRIERMIENEVAFSRADFDYAEQYLKDGCLNADTRGRCLNMLAELYNHRARMYYDKAGEIARQALELNPEDHGNHAAFCEAMNGEFMDWCITNHTRIIEFYQDYVKKHPKDRAGYLWLMGNLMADGRLEEAKAALKAMEQTGQSYHTLLYQGWIARYEKGWDAAFALWDQMVETYPEDWHVWFSRADGYAKRAMYPQAIADYQRSTELQAAPRFIDSFQSIAQICTLIGDRQGAIRAYEEVVRILREEWDMQEGETVLGFLENIAQLRREAE